ncbi:MAG: adenylate kinase [Anaerolineales bacterium]|jgi:adenylate kinase
MNVILLGAPGSGKGTQAETIQTTLGLTHVASGDLFRYNLKNRTELGLMAEAYMNRGELVPDDVTVAMVRDRIQQPDIQEGVLLDGFPRTLPQARALEEMLAQMDQQVDAVIYLVVPDEEIITRLTGRLICKECQTPFHKVFNPFVTCPYDKCHGEYLYQRDDDKPETVKARLQTFHNQTRPLVEYYDQRGVLHRVSGTGQINEVGEAVIAALRAVQNRD